MSVLSHDPPDLGIVCAALIEQTGQLSQQVLALINLNSILIRELALTQADPLGHFSKLEAEIGGMGEAIALATQRFTDVEVSSVPITEVFETVLRQTRNSLERRMSE